MDKKAHDAALAIEVEQVAGGQMSVRPAGTKQVQNRRLFSPTSALQTFWAAGDAFCVNLQKLRITGVPSPQSGAQRPGWTPARARNPGSRG